VFAEYKRLNPAKFGRQFGRQSPENFAFGLHLDSTTYDTADALTRAVVIPSIGRLETTTNRSYI
jgi:hypothetical protein